MNIYLDGQDKNTAVMFNRMIAQGDELFNDYEVKAQKARVLIQEMSFFFEQQKPMLPLVKVQIKGYVVGYDNVDLIDNRGQGILDRVEELDPQKAINMTYTLNRAEYNMLVNGGGYDNVDFVAQARNIFRNQIFTMPLTVYERHFKKWVLVDSKIQNYDLNHRKNTTFNKLYKELMMKMIEMNQHQDFAATKLDVNKALENNVSGIELDSELDLSKNPETSAPIDDTDEEIKTVSF